VKIQYDPTLMETMVTQAMRSREETGDISLARQYHRLADPIYDKEMPEGRDKAFQTIFQELFVKWKLRDIFAEAIAEFPLFEEAALVYFKLTMYQKDAGADLMAKDREAGPKVIMIQLLAGQCAEEAGLRKFLRHEFMHVSDILDEAFRYEEALVEGVPAENWVMDRYRLLWDIYIDGRLSDNGKSTAGADAGHRGEFTRLYRKIPEEQRQEAFEWFSGARGLTHADILQLAKDTGHFLKEAEIAYEPGSAEADMSETANLPGAPCPLCNFPTYYWEEDLPARLEDPMAKVIQENHPGWTPHDGACPRCIEGYKSLAGNNRMLLHHDATPS
jgi:hypothetical protein